MPFRPRSISAPVLLFCPSRPCSISVAPFVVLCLSFAPYLCRHSSLSVVHPSCPATNADARNLSRGFGDACGDGLSHHRLRACVPLQVYMPCVYALNKIDAITMEELDILDAIPHYCPISVRRTRSHTLATGRGCAMPIRTPATLPHHAYPRNTLHAPRALGR